jgi:hypothetical protein
MELTLSQKLVMKYLILAPTKAIDEVLIDLNQKLMDKTTLLRDEEIKKNLGLVKPVKRITELIINKKGNNCYPNALFFSLVRTEKEKQEKLFELISQGQKDPIPILRSEDYRSNHNTIQDFFRLIRAQNKS